MKALKHKLMHMNMNNIMKYKNIKRSDLVKNVREGVNSFEIYIMTSKLLV